MTCKRMAVAGRASVSGHDESRRSAYTIHQRGSEIDRCGNLSATGGNPLIVGANTLIQQL